MNILAVDTDSSTLKKLEKSLHKTVPDAERFFFDSSLSALAKARESEVDIAILETDMPELNGIDLGIYLKELNPNINLIYISNSTDHAYDALRIHSSGYLKKPFTDKDLKKELDSLRYPEIQKNYKRVFAQTFGNFELFVDGSPVEFKYKRTKEIVALLISNKGAQTTNGEIIASLWEDDGDPDKKLSYLCNLRQDLQNTFSKLKLNGIILKQRGSMAISKDSIECDLYDWLENKDASKYRYTGEFMNQYSWAEYYHEGLDDYGYT